jgi:predicted ester cyclase
MQRDDNDRLYRRMLLELWHADDGDLDTIAAQIAADDLVLYQNGTERSGAKALADLVRQGRAPFTDVVVAIETGPLIDGDHVAARWSFSGAYAGGLPGVTAPEGPPVRFTGIDMVRVAGERIADYWVCSDGAALMAQLGA